MTACLLLAAAVVTIGAAVRSTWSPCGLSMLASITPLSERRAWPPLPRHRGVVRRGRHPRWRHPGRARWRRSLSVSTPSR